MCRVTIAQMNRVWQSVRLFSAHSPVHSVFVARGGMCVCHSALLWPKPQVGLLLYAVVGCI